MLEKENLVLKKPNIQTTPFDWKRRKQWQFQISKYISKIGFREYEWLIKPSKKSSDANQWRVYTTEMSSFRQSNLPN